MCVYLCVYVCVFVHVEQVWMRAQVVKLKHAVTHILHEVPVCVCV